jgi:hypothetical protein
MKVMALLSHGRKVASGRRSLDTTAIIERSPGACGPMLTNRVM